MNYKKRIVILFLTFSILIGGIYIPAPKASAAGAFGVTITNVQDLLLWIKRVVVRIMARKLMTMLSNSLIKKIQGGGRDGGASFVRNWANFITDAQYRGEDIFKAVLASTPVCGYLDKSIKDAFRVGDNNKLSFAGNNTRIGSLDPFNLRAACTLPSGFNMDAYRNDFTGNGGWDAWSRLLEPQNNYYGLLFSSLDELAKQRDLAQTADLAEVANSGYNSIRDGCQDVSKAGYLEGESQGPTLTNNARCSFMGKVFTPGDLLGKTAAATIDSEMGWLINSSEVADIVVSILNAVVDRLGNLAESALMDPENGSGDAMVKANFSEEFCVAKQPSAEANAFVQQNYPDAYAKFPPTEDCWDVLNSDGDGTDEKCGLASYCSTITDSISDNPYPTQNCISECLKLTNATTPNLINPSPIETGPPGSIELPVCKATKNEAKSGKGGLYVWGMACTTTEDPKDGPNTCLVANKVLTDNIKNANGCSDLKNSKSPNCQQAMQKICQVAFCAASIQSSNWYGWTPTYSTDTFENTGNRSRAFSVDSVGSFCEKNNFLNLGFSKKNNTLPTATTICAVSPDNVAYDPQLLREPTLGILSSGNTYEAINQTSTPENPLVQCSENNMPIMPNPITN